MNYQGAAEVVYEHRTQNTVTGCPDASSSRIAKIAIDISISVSNRIIRRRVQKDFKF